MRIPWKLQLNKFFYSFQFGEYFIFPAWYAPYHLNSYWVVQKISKFVSHTLTPFFKSEEHIQTLANSGEFQQIFQTWIPVNFHQNGES